MAVTGMGWWRGLVVATVLAVGLPSVGAVAPAAGQVAVPGPIDNNDRAAVAEAYRNWLLPALATPAAFTGNVATCLAGEETEASRNATLAAVNYYRAMTGLPAVTNDEARNAAAQEAAVMMDRNNQLSHNPPSDWPCYTAAADEAAGQSNLAMGAAGAAAVPLYMRDPGSTDVGHRRWLLYPPRTSMATGSTTRVNVLNILAGGNARPVGPTWVAWPPAGYVPWAIVPRNGSQLSMWSLSSNQWPGASYSDAQVSMTYGEETLTVTEQPVVGFYGDTTLVWAAQRSTGAAFDMSGLAEFTVSVTGIVGGPPGGEHTYVVKAFETDAPAPVTDFAIAGGMGTATLTWTNPADADLATVEVRRVQGTVAPTPTTGSRVCLVTAPTATCEVSGMNRSKAYTFAAFASDEVDNRSAGEAVTLNGATLTATAAPATLKFGQGAVVSGTLAGSDAQGLGGQTVVLHSRTRRTDGTWRPWQPVTSAQTETGATPGAYAFAVAPPRNLQYRVTFAGGDAQQGTVSAARTVAVSPVVTLNLSKTAMALGSNAVVAGSVKPNLAGTLVTLQQRRGTGDWTNLARVALSDTSRYRFVVSPGRRGVYRYRVRVPASVVHLLGESPVGRLDVT